jgi:hypothetical protein
MTDDVVQRVQQMLQIARPVVGGTLLQLQSQFQYRAQQSHATHKGARGSWGIMQRLMGESLRSRSRRSGTLEATRKSRSTSENMQQLNQGLLGH